jgi:hypothetical protein
MVSIDAGEGAPIQVVYADVEQGLLLAGKRGATWIDRLLEAGPVTVRREGSKRASQTMTASEPSSDDRVELWQHIHEVLPTRSAAKDDPNTRLVLLTPT